MSRQCKATTKAGTPCEAPPLGGSDFCFHHDPAHEAERAAARRAGGLSLHYGATGRAHVEPVTLKNAADVIALLETAATDLMGRKPGVQRARGLVYVATTALKAVEVHDLAQRVEALEERLQPRGAA